MLAQKLCFLPKLGPPLRGPFFVARFYHQSERPMSVTPLGILASILVPSMSTLQRSGNRMKRMNDNDVWRLKISEI